MTGGDGRCSSDGRRPRHLQLPLRHQEVHGELTVSSALPRAPATSPSHWGTLRLAGNTQAFLPVWARELVFGEAEGGKEPSSMRKGLLDHRRLTWLLETTRWQLKSLEYEGLERAEEVG